MGYTDIGYNQFLTRDENFNNEITQFDPMEFEQASPEFSGAKLQGIIQSQDGRVRIDLDNNSIIISDGVVERVRLGKQSDDSYGIRVLNKAGNILMQFDDNRNLIQVGSQNVQLDFDNEYLLISEGGVGKVLIGKDQGGF